MSVTHLEEFVQMMVKSSNAGLTENAAKSVDGPNWRETFHRLVARCRRSKDKASRSGDKVSFANAIEPANGVVSEYSPIVSLYDVLKFKANDEDFFSKEPLNQDEFLNYFGLSLNNNRNKNKMSERSEQKLWNNSHPRHLLNTPQVPFSSDLGLKLIKERPEIPREIHERKIERLERYLQNIPISDDVEYEVTYNKNVDIDSSHFYIFPHKNFHDKNKLTPKARHLLKKYCKPCTVNLRRLDTKKLNCLVSKQMIVQTDQKENVQLLKSSDILLEDRVVLTDSIQSPSSQSFPDRTNFLPKSIPTSDNEKRTRQRNLLKTLTPRDENKMVDESEMENTKDFVNACVVLQPINNLMKLKKNETTTNSNVQKQKKISNGRIEKKKINTRYPRRFSPRLKIVNTPLIM